MPKRIAIIPARGGSKRIANKNVRDFCGRPMIAHVLHAARESGLFDAVHVSTESSGIRDTVEKLGWPVDFLRPDELADDYTPVMPVLRFVVESYAARGDRFDEVWLLMACAPFITAQDLVEAATLFQSAGGEQPLLAVAQFPVPIEWAFTRAPTGQLTPVQRGMFATRSQDLPPKYFDAGSFAAFPEKAVRESTGAGSDTGFIGYVLPKDRVVDIDDEADWMIAEALFTLRGRDP